MSFDNSKLFTWAVDHGFNPSKVPADMPANWTITALHPATPNAGPVTGIPDLDTQPSLMFRWAQTDMITPPSGLTAGDTWDVDVIHFPGPGVFAAYRVRKSNTTPWTTGWIDNNQYPWDGSPPMVDATTGALTNFGNTGSWTKDITKYRLSYAGYTGVLNAASLSDQGMCVAVQMQSPYFEAPMGQTKEAATGLQMPTYDLAWVVQSLNYNYAGSAFPSYDNLFSVSPTAEQWRARDGYYLPLRFRDGNFHWQDAQRMSAKLMNPWDGGSSGNHFVSAVPINGNGSLGVVCMRGLASTTTLSLTARVGYECCVNGQSALRAFVTKSCPPDMLALQEYFALSSVLADVYPSIYNEDDILGAILTHLCAKLPPPINKLLPPLLTAGGRMVFGKTTKKNRAKPETAKVSEVLEEDTTLAGQTPPTKQKKRSGPMRKVAKALPIPGKRMVKSLAK